MELLKKKMLIYFIKFRLESKCKSNGKKHMLILDMIDNNKWERPIYFSITIGNSAHSYAYLWDYFQLDGLAYRLVPIKTKSQAKLVELNLIYYIPV